jgi:hypothetical protein
MFSKWHELELFQFIIKQCSQYEDDIVTIIHTDYSENI